MYLLYLMLFIMLFSISLNALYNVIFTASIIVYGCSTLIIGFLISLHSASIHGNDYRFIFTALGLPYYSLLIPLIRLVNLLFHLQI